MTVSLDAALSGLRVAQQALNVLSTNIANAQTPGYTRKILPQETLLIAGSAVGARSLNLLRHVDQTLLRDLVKQTSLSKSAEVREKYLSRIQDFHGPSESGRSLSSQLGKLSDAFSELSSSPDSNLLLSATVSAAQQLTSKINEFATLINNQRNQANNEIQSSVNLANQAIETIAELNVRIGDLMAEGKSTVELEDQRDIAIRELSKYIQISTFTAENNRIVVMTKEGQTLADGSARTLVFDNDVLTPSSYYPGGGASGLYIDSTSGTEVTQGQVGGSIGALFTLRDETLASYQAQLDELAQKLASRFDSQGLRLFTDPSGNVPANVAPPGVVGYVGFANRIQVNADIVADPTLLRSGTYGATVLPGSNEIIRKISEFAFGAYAYEQGTGTADISAGTIFAATGMTPYNRIVGDVDLTDYLPDLDAAPNITAPAVFDLTIGVTTYNITINPGDTATDLVNTINTAVGSNVAALDGLGHLVFNTTADVTLADNTIGAAGMADLGFSFGAYPASDPSFTVQIGTQSPITVTIDSADTATDLLATLNAIPGLTATLGSSGELILTPTYGGDLTLKNTTGTPLTDLGVTISSVAHTAFRTDNLGAGGDLSTGLLGNSTLGDFSRGIITAQGEDHALSKNDAEKEASFLTTLDQRHSNESGVDIDQELSELIRIQTAYTAAARMITATEKAFNDLIGAFGAG